MDEKNIIIILLVIIIVLISAIGIMYFQPGFAKDPTVIKVTSDKTQYEEGKISVKLTDLNKTPISKQKVDITVINSKGKTVLNESVKTNSKGKASCDFDLKKGKYVVNVTYAGNENYSANNTSQKLTVEKEVKTASVSSSSSSSSLPYSINNLPPSNDPNPETRRYQVDEYTVIQEYSDNYRSIVDLRTGERHGGWI